MTLAQALLEKGALDGLSAGLVQFRYHATEFLKDERAVAGLAMAIVLLLAWRLRR